VTVGDVLICRVELVSSTSTAPADVQERVTKILRRPVVDDGVDTRVEVRQTVPQHAHRLRHSLGVSSTGGTAGGHQGTARSAEQAYG